MIFNDGGWYSMTVDDAQWRWMIVNDGGWWSMTADDDQWWWMIVNDGGWCIIMIMMYNDVQ